jgi:hypothetical protein
LFFSVEAGIRKGDLVGGENSKIMDSDGAGIRKQDRNTLG